jgi:putative transcriptional regulator
MKKSDFAQLLQGTTELGRALRGESRRGDIARRRRIDPEGVAAVRSRLGLSQPQFARLLGVGLGTLRHWEQGRRQPTGAARVLLRVAAHNPQAVLEAVA